MKLDLHTHTKYSGDSWCCPGRAVSEAKKKGLDGLAITDHNTTRAWKLALEAGKKLDVLVVPGEEVKVLEKGQKVGEILGLFMTEPVNSTDPLEVIDIIRAQGGVVVVPHPFDGFRGFKELRDVMGKVHGLEVMNSRASKEANKMARQIASHHNLTQTGGSDAHSLGEIGKAWTEADVSDLEGFRKALLGKKTKVMGKESGPLVHLLSAAARLQKLKIHKVRF